MLRPRGHPVQPDGGSDDEGNDAASLGVCYDAMSSFNVTVSLGHKNPSPPAGSAASRQTCPRHTSTSRSVDTASLESRSLDSGSTSVSRGPSLAESIGSFDPEKAEAEARKALVRMSLGDKGRALDRKGFTAMNSCHELSDGSGLLSGDMSGAFPESIKRAEEVMQHTRETLARADGAARDSLTGGSDGGHDSLSTEELEGLSRALKRALFVCPNHKGLHAMRGEVHRRLQDLRTAVGCLRLAVRMDKSALNVRQRLAEGMVWLDGGDSEAALACFEEACTVDGANASVHSCKTVALVKLGRFVEALRSVEAVLGRRKGTADDYVLRAKIRWAVGMVGPGNIDLGIAKTLQSDHPEVVMFGRRCLGNAEGLYAKAKELADAGDDVRAVKVGRGQRG
ncbi:unnamed protein product [Ectocarpus sp. CCAP 1310/34]|nr:unnamed protein product [Ectocarpus sp. CCAP 1310/34]